MPVPPAPAGSGPQPTTPFAGSGASLPLAGHTVLGELGRGGMGVVYKVRQERLKRVVAVKMVLAGGPTGPEGLARFYAEAEAVARLHHPNVVQLYEMGELDGHPYFIFEYVGGSTLQKRLEGRPQPPRAAAELVETLARAVHAAHLRGIVHRDLKPANILLEPPPMGAADGGAEGEPDAAHLYGLPKIADFGLAKRLDHDAGPSEAGQVLGTPLYMAPEQARGHTEDVGPAADVYALGAILYEMLTGRPPIPSKGGGLQEMICRIVSEPPAPPGRLRRGLSRDLEAVCLKCLEKDPHRRYRTALALADDLARWRRGEPVRARPPRGPERLWRWCLLNPVPACLLLTVTLGSAFGLWHLSRLSESIVRTTALEGAAQESEMLGQANTFYTDVVRRAQLAGAEATHDYQTKEGAIPIPATFTIELGKRIQESGETGMRLRLYSEYPFRNRADGGPHDDFERAALDRLKENPEEPFYRFEDHKGRPALRYATARKMLRTCVDCHNTHPESTKKDWKVGDVRGVMEIIRPLDRDMAQTSAGLRSTFALMGGVAAGLLALSGVVLAVGKRRHG
jgi:serine/threonine protein kinase